MLSAICVLCPNNIQRNTLWNTKSGTPSWTADSDHSPSACSLQVYRLKGGILQTEKHKSVSIWTMNPDTNPGKCNLPGWVEFQQFNPSPHYGFSILGIEVAVDLISIYATLCLE